MYLLKSLKGKTQLFLGVFITLGVFLVGCATSESESEYLEVGATAPDFNLPTVSGDTYTFSEGLGEQPVLLYFSMADG